MISLQKIDKPFEISLQQKDKGFYISLIDKESTNEWFRFTYKLPFKLLQGITTHFPYKLPFKLK